MEHGEARWAPVAAPLVDPVPLPAIAAGENRQHVLRESRLRQARRVVAPQQATTQRWVWALLLSCPQPISSFDAIADLPHGSIITALLGGEVRDIAGLQDLLSPSMRVALAGRSDLLEALPT